MRIDRSHNVFRREEAGQDMRPQHGRQNRAMFGLQQDFAVLTQLVEPVIGCGQHRIAGRAIKHGAKPGFAQPHAEGGQVLTV